MTTNPHFIALLIQGGFSTDLPRKCEETFSALVLKTGSYLGSIRMYGMNFHHRLPSLEDDARLQESLRLPQKITVGAEPMFIIHDMLKKQFTVRGWFNSKTVPLLTLAPWDSYAVAEKVALATGAAEFMKKRPLLNLVIEVTSRGFISTVERREINYSTDVQISNFPSLLQKAWSEFQLTK
jgi:hypothetical protein